MPRKKAADIPIIGVTGGFGMGKTTVSGYFKRLGAKVIDADRIARGALKKVAPSYRMLVRAFGRGILDRRGRIDRARLAGAAFGDKKSLKKLRDITHPYIIRKIRAAVRRELRRGMAPAVVIEAPLLIESGLHAMADYIVVVRASRASQFRRIKKRTGLGRREALKRIAGQMSIIEKIKMADFVIANDGTKRETEKAVKKIWEGIKSGRRQ